MEGKNGLPRHPAPRRHIRGVKAGAGLAPGPRVAALCCSPFPHSFTPQLGQCGAGGTLVSLRGAARRGHLGVKRGQTALEWPEAAAKKQPQLVLGWRGLLVTFLSDLGNFP